MLQMAGERAAEKGGLEWARGSLESSFINVNTV